MKKVSILVPCYNEEQSIPLLYQELCKLAEAESAYEFEFLFINDGSRDETITKLESLRSADKRC